MIWFGRTARPPVLSYLRWPAPAQAAPGLLHGFLVPGASWLAAELPQPADAALPQVAHSRSSVAAVTPAQPPQPAVPES
jgi:hypothetical protein